MTFLIEAKMILLYTRINTQQRVQYNHVIWAVTIQNKIYIAIPNLDENACNNIRKQQQQQQHNSEHFHLINLLITQSMTWRKCCFHIFLYDKRLSV